ncbi:MAG: hypothetical protein GY768_04685, partial [Planctomycetaceae bacterium]|nr:hypothetical protein [Planctomycetaceae bacterium]
MELLPSLLQLHKHVNGVDTRLASINRPTSLHPLERTLGMVEFGAFAQADPTAPFAFCKTEDLLDSIELVDGDDEECNTTALEPCADVNSEGEVPHDAIAADALANEEVGAAIISDRIHMPVPSKPSRHSRRTKEAEETEREEATERQPNGQIPIEPSSRGRQRFLPQRFKDTTLASAARARRLLGEPEAKSIRKQAPPTSEEQIRELYANCMRSRDSLFFLRYKHPTIATTDWYAARVHLEDKDDHELAKTQGIYKMNWLVPHPK